VQSSSRPVVLQRSEKIKGRIKRKLKRAQEKEKHERKQMAETTKKKEENVRRKRVRYEKSGCFRFA